MTEKEKNHHTSRHRSSHSSSSAKRRHHHSDRHKYSSNRDISSEMERRGENIIYDKVRKERIALMIKRSIFCILATAFLVFVVISMTSSGGTSGGFRFFNNTESKQEINDMKIKIVDYEHYIEELEERLSKYEEVESIFNK